MLLQLSSIRPGAMSKHREVVWVALVCASTSEGKIASKVQFYGQQRQDDARGSAMKDDV